jgi:hypothetical protein
MIFFLRFRYNTSTTIKEREIRKVMKKRNTDEKNGPWASLWRLFPYPVSIVLTVLSFLVFFLSAVFSSHFTDHAFKKYTVKVSSAQLSDCSGGIKGNQGQCAVNEQVVFSNGQTGSYRISDGGTLNPTLSGDFNVLQTPTLSDFNIYAGKVENIWLKRMSNIYAFDYAPNTNATVLVRAICFFLFFLFGIRALVLRNRKKNQANSTNTHSS